MFFSLNRPAAATQRDEKNRGEIHTGECQVRPRPGYMGRMRAGAASLQGGQRERGVRRGGLRKEREGKEGREEGREKQPERVWQARSVMMAFRCSVDSDSLQPLFAAHQAALTFLQSLLKLMSIEFMMPPNHLILRHPLLLLPSIFPSIRVSSNESVLRIRWPKYWSFSFSISLSNEYSGLISFRMDWFDLLAVQGTLKSLLQHHSSKASIFGTQISL